MVPAIVLGCALIMMLVELARPGRSFPRVSGWILRCVLLNGLQALVVFLPGVAWEPWMRAHRPFTSHLGPGSGALVGYLTLTFVYYWWHRARHASPLLWRLLHQVHHSPQRIEVLTSFYKHPLEILSNGVITSATLYLACGLGPEAATGAVLLAGLAELFYHWNVSTPRWLGFLVQRPESHCVHHQEGLHAYNYGDLAIWDALFGTLHNPKKWDARCGFGPEGEGRLGAMLAFRDVNP